MSIIQASKQHLMSGFTSSVMIMKLWVLVPLIVQVHLIKFPGDSYQWLEYCYKGLWFGGCRFQQHTSIIRLMMTLK